MTSTFGRGRGGVTEKMTKVDKGRGGVKICQILDDVICKWSLKALFHCNCCKNTPAAIAPAFISYISMVTMSYFFLIKLTKTKTYYQMKTCISILSIFCTISIHGRGVYRVTTFSHFHIIYIIYFLKLFTSFHSFYSHLYQVDFQNCRQTPSDWYLYQASFQIFLPTPPDWY